MIYAVNYLAVLVAGLVGVGLGALWYSPKVFGMKWMQWSGITPKMTPDGKPQGMGKAYTVGAVASLVTAYVLAIIIALSGAFTISGAFAIAFWVWLGFFAAPMTGIVLWEMKSWKLWALNAGYFLVDLVVMSLILAWWV